MVFFFLANVFMLSCFSCVKLFVILLAVAYQAPLPMEFSRQGYWSGLPGEFLTTRATWEASSLQTRTWILTEGIQALSRVCISLLPFKIRFAFTHDLKAASFLYSNICFSLDYVISSAQALMITSVIN